MERPLLIGQELLGQAILGKFLADDEIRTHDFHVGNVTLYR